MLRDSTATKYFSLARQVELLAIPSVYGCSAQMSIPDWRGSHENRTTIINEVFMPKYAKRQQSLNRISARQRISALGQSSYQNKTANDPAERAMGGGLLRELRRV